MCGKVGLFEPTLEMGVMSEVRTIGVDLAKRGFVRPEGRAWFCFTGGEMPLKKPAVPYLDMRSR
jgi:hypothetical protein